VHTYDIVPFGEGNFDVRILAAFFCQYLDSVVIVFMRGASIIVPATSRNRMMAGAPGASGSTRHLQFFRRNRLESGDGVSRHRTEKETNNKPGDAQREKYATTLHRAVHLWHSVGSVRSRLWGI
jgi:hypothetical protein